MEPPTRKIGQKLESECIDDLLDAVAACAVAQASGQLPRIPFVRVSKADLLRCPTIESRNLGAKGLGV